MFEISPDNEQIQTQSSSIRWYHVDKKSVTYFCITPNSRDEGIQKP